jgi:uncharacterized protein YbjT (DUF2867 family)
MTKILVAGGTGFIGSEIVRALSETAENEVVVLGRSSNKMESLFPGLKIEHRQGDVTNPQTLVGKLKDIDVVINCVQFPNHPVQNKSKGYTYEKYDGEGTQNLCAEINRSQVKRVIYISGAGTSPDKPEPWFKAKVKAEAAVIGTGREYVILRPSWVYGPEDHSMNKFIAFGNYLPAMPVIGDGKYLVTPVFVKDLAQVCARAVTLPISAHETVDVGGPETLSMNEIQEKVLKVLGKTKPLMHQPLWFMKIAGGIMSAVLPTPPLSAEAVEFVTMNNPVDGRRAEKIFDFKFTNLESALHSYIEKQE